MIETKLGQVLLFPASPYLLFVMVLWQSNSRDRLFSETKGKKVKHFILNYVYIVNCLFN